MEGPSTLRQNLESLLDGLDKLKHLRDRLKGRREKKMQVWLQEVDQIERNVDVIQQKFNKSKFVFRILPGFRRKLFENINRVKLLEEMANEVLDSISMFIVMEIEEGNIRQFSDKQLRSYTSNFRDLVGHGGFGDVYKGKFPNDVQIAVKVLKNKYKVDIMEEQFLAEVRTVGRTYHRNLVKLFGYCFDVELKALVFEYMENGSLDKILYQNHPSISWEKLYSIAIETAKGLSYLHENCNEQIIHHDIKASNVLLDSNFCSKLADFGLANLPERDVSQVTMIGFRGTRGYAAPEVCLEGAVVTYKCDIYSFGMLLFEILRRKRNDEGKEWFPGEVWEKYENGLLNEIILECGIREEDMEKAKTLSQVALWCAQFKPEDRPSMSTVVKILEGDVQPLPLLNPFPYHASNAGGSTRTSGTTPAWVFSLVSPASMERLQEGEQSYKNLRTASQQHPT